VMAAKTATKPRAENNAGTTRGKPFKPGNTAGFKPGQSGNSGGRPRTRELTDALAKIVKPAKLAKELNRLALEAEENTIRLQAIKYIYDRFEGTPLHRSEVTIDDVAEAARRMAREQGEDEAAAVREALAIFRGEKVSA